MDVIRGFMNWPLKVKIEKSEGLASRASPCYCLFVVSRFSRGAWLIACHPKGENLEPQP